MVENILQIFHLRYFCSTLTLMIMATSVSWRIGELFICKTCGYEINCVVFGLTLLYSFVWIFKNTNTVYWDFGLGLRLDNGLYPSSGIGSTWLASQTFPAPPSVTLMSSSLGMSQVTGLSFIKKVKIHFRNYQHLDFRHWKCQACAPNENRWQRAR